MSTTESGFISLEVFHNWKSKKIEIIFKEDDIRTAYIKEVKAIGQNENNDRTSYSVLLQTSMREQYYTQGTFKVLLPDQQESFMFMVPVGLDSEKNGMQYEVIYC